MITIADLRWRGVREEKITGIGEFETLRNGRRREKTRCVAWIDTYVAGQMPLSDWIRKMETAVAAEGQQELLEKIEAHVEKLPFVKAKDRREYALECLSEGAYMHWEGFR